MEINGKKIMVVGGAGFIGSHIIDQLVAEYDVEITVFDNFYRGTKPNLDRAIESGKVNIVEGDITDYGAVEKAMKGHDGCFHLAALWLLQCQEDPIECSNVNVLGCNNVFKACVETGIKKIVYSSSASVYGEPSHLPIDEDHPFNNRTAYGASKVANEQFARAYHDVFGLKNIGLRYFNAYGPRQDYKGAYVSVIMRFLDNIRNGVAPVLFGDGSQSMDFIYVGDIARANILAMKSNSDDIVLNVGSGTDTSLLELADLLLDLTGSDLKPKLEKQEAVLVQRRRASTELAEEKIGFKSTTDIREGMKNLVDWHSGDSTKS